MIAHPHKEYVVFVRSLRTVFFFFRGGQNFYLLSEFIVYYANDNEWKTGRIMHGTVIMMIVMRWTTCVVQAPFATFTCMANGRCSLCTRLRYFSFSIWRGMCTDEREREREREYYIIWLFWVIYQSNAATKLHSKALTT